MASDIRIKIKHKVPKSRLIEELAEEIDKVKQSDFFRNYLDTMSRFWKYSYHNQMLIFRQMPTATRIAGFRKWQEMNRWVKKGSKSIRILAPFVRKKIEVDPKTGEEKAITYYCPVSVFDESQTKGQPLPEIDITINGDGYRDFLNHLIDFYKSKNMKVDFKSLGINGLYGYSMGGQIVIADTTTINTQVNTLIHEVAHEILSHKDHQIGRQQKEIQAEGVAYVVTKHFGMQNKSFNYLALYHTDYKKIMENLKAIAEASKEIIEFLENKAFTTLEVH